MAERCACGQYPDVCARYGHARGYSEAAVDRLAKVQRRTTYVISLWIYGQDKHADPPADVLGPFTKIEAERIAATLTCEYRLDSIRTDVPEWAKT